MEGATTIKSVGHTSLGAVMVESVENLLAIGSIEFDEVADLRRHLEVPAVRLTAAHRTDVDLADLKGIVASPKVGERRRLVRP